MVNSYRRMPAPTIMIATGRRKPIAPSEVYFLAAVPTTLVAISDITLPPTMVAAVGRFPDNPGPPRLMLIRPGRGIPPMAVTALIPIPPSVISIVQSFVKQIAHRCARENLGQVSTSPCYLYWTHR